MNKFVNTAQLAHSLQDAKCVAEMAMRQLDGMPCGLNRSISDLLLNDPFALGYAIGFAKQACNHANRGTLGEEEFEYQCSVIGNMLGNTSVAALFVNFAHTKQGDRMFEGGFDIGVRDMSDWCSSYGGQVPQGLLRYLCDEPERV